MCWMARTQSVSKKIDNNKITLFCSFDNHLSEDGFCTQSRPKANEFQSIDADHPQPKEITFKLFFDKLLE